MDSGKPGMTDAFTFRAPLLDARMLRQTPVAALLLTVALCALAAPPASALHMCENPKDPCCAHDCCNYDPECIEDNATHDLPSGGACTGGEMLCIDFGPNYICVTVNANIPPLPPISIQKYCIYYL